MKCGLQQIQPLSIIYPYFRNVSDGEQMSNLFRACNVMLPVDCDFNKWAVIACDQHTSERDYWEDVKEYIADAPSTLNMFSPSGTVNVNPAPVSIVVIGDNISLISVTTLFTSWSNIA